jgi:signal transduction histidine kinase
VTFRVRTAIVVLILTSLTMGGAFAGVWGWFVRSERRQLDAALLLVARREASAVANGQLEFSDEPGPLPNGAGPLPKYGVLYRRNGAPLFNTKNFMTVPPMPTNVVLDQGFDFDHEGIPMRGVMIAVAATGREILLASPRDDFEEDARLLARAMTVAFLVGCVWAAIVAFGVATSLTRDHRIVGDVARRVASGDTSARVAFRSRDADLRRFADDLNAMIERLVGLLAVRERFIAHAAHELRTPLTALRIEIEHVLRVGRDRSDYEAALRSLLDSAERLTALAEDLLQLARLQAAPSDDVALLADALRDGITDVSAIVRAREVVVVRDPSTGTVRGDRRSLARLFRNVLENAVRFSPRGGRVRVDTRAQDDRAVVTISDEGPGVDPSDAERIFEPFARASREQDDEGTGLGLAIARGIARSFEGDVTVETGAGGRFVIELPLVCTTAPAAETTDRSDAREPPQQLGFAAHRRG